MSLKPLAVKPLAMLSKRRSRNSSAPKRISVSSVCGFSRPIKSRLEVRFDETKTYRSASSDLRLNSLPLIKSNVNTPIAFKDAADVLPSSAIATPRQRRGKSLARRKYQQGHVFQKNRRKSDQWLPDAPSYVQFWR